VRLRHAGPVVCVAFDSDGKHLLTASGGVAVLWDALTGRPVRRFGKRPADPDRGPAGFRPGETVAALSADGKAVALAYRPEDGVRVWDVATGNELRRFRGETSGAAGLAFSPDGKLLASAGKDGHITLHDLTTGKETARLLRAPKGGAPFGLGFTPPVFAPDGKALAVPCHEVVGFNNVKATISLWDPTTGRRLRQLEAGGPAPVTPAFSPNGKGLAWSTANGTIIVTDAATGQERRRFEAGGPCRFAFTPDGKRIVATLVHGRLIIIWDAATGRELRRFVKARPVPPHPDWRIPAWAPSGRSTTRETARRFSRGGTMARCDGGTRPPPGKWGPPCCPPAPGNRHCPPMGEYLSPKSGTAPPACATRQRARRSGKSTSRRKTSTR
jgi:WD40 repeat protein